MSRTRGIPKVSFEDALSMTVEEGGYDRNAETLRTSLALVDEHFDIVQRAFSELPTPVSEESVRLAASHRGKICAAHEATIENMLSIGNWLIDLRARLPGKAFDRFMETDILPFEKNWAFKLMAVAEKAPTFAKVIGETYQPSRLPSITVCYELSTLSESHLQKAKEEGLLAPTTTVRALGEFKSKIKQAVSRTDLMRQLKKKRMELAKLQARAASLQDEIRQLEAKLPVPAKA